MNGGGGGLSTDHWRINVPTPDRKKAKKILMATFGSLVRVFIRYLALLTASPIQLASSLMKMNESLEWRSRARKDHKEQ